MMNFFQNDLKRDQTNEGLDFPHVVLDLDPALKKEVTEQTLRHINATISVSHFEPKYLLDVVAWGTGTGDYC